MLTTVVASATVAAMTAAALARRIEQILKKRDISQRELSRRSGLKETHVGMILTRLKKNPGADIERETLAAIAKGGETSLTWLAEGIGTIDDPAVTYEPEARYSELERVLTARHVGAEVRAALWRRAAHTGAGQTIDEATANAWVDEQIAIHKGKAQVKPYEAGDDEPPAAKRKTRKGR